MTTTADTILTLDEVSKKFVVHKDKSIKDRLLYFGSRDKSRTEFWALKDVSLTVTQGETVGLIGHNGSGKSTLLKLIGGIIDISGGKIMRKGRVAALLELGAGFHPDLTGRENVYINAAILGMTTAETDEVFDDIVEFSGIGEFIDTQVKFYSSGMYVRLAFGVAVHSDPDVLLVDEVLAVGDEPFQRKCMNKIREFQREGRTILLVSHSAEQVADVCTRAIVLDGGVVIHDGEVGEAIRVLRDGYERDRVEELDRKEETKGPAAEPAVRLLGITVSSNGVAVDETPIEIDSTLSFSIEAEVLKPSEWITGITLQSMLGQTVYLLNSEGLKLDLPTQPGRYRVQLTIPRVNFGRERLILSMGITDRAGNILDLNQFAGHLDFEPDPAGGGLVQFAASGSVSRL